MRRVHRNGAARARGRGSRLALVCIPLIVSAAVSGIAACGGQGASARDSARPTIEVTSVKDLGVLETSPEIRGRDGGYSAVFQHRSVWVFGDTILARADANGRTWHTNSWSWTSDLRASDGIHGFQERRDEKGVALELFPRTLAERAFDEAHLGEHCRVKPCGAHWSFWAGPIVVDPKRDRALVFYDKVYAQSGLFNFRGVGRSLAVLKSVGEQVTRPVPPPRANKPALLFSEQEGPFGDAAVVVGDTLYAYGCKDNGLTKGCRVARVPLAHAFDRDWWRYYAGAGRWVLEIQRAAVVFNGNDIVSVAWNPYLSSYLAVYSEPLSTRVMMRTAKQPEGPWTDPIEVFRAKTPSEDPKWVYDALTHAEYQGDRGRVQ